jgi:hypothetical protein
MEKASVLSPRSNRLRFGLDNRFSAPEAGSSPCKPDSHPSTRNRGVAGTPGLATNLLRELGYNSAREWPRSWITMPPFSVVAWT